MIVFRGTNVFIRRLFLDSGTYPRKTKAAVHGFYSDSEKKIKKKDVSPETMPKVYTPKTCESEWYDWWESKGYFSATNTGRAFTMILPPPNVTGVLHLGHAWTITIQDVYLRWLRMKGENVVWIPGFDHAGVATQIMVEKYLKSTLNRSRADIGKDEFVRHVNKWKEGKEVIMTRQIKKMGASVDWSKKYFTMDPKTSKAVSSAFIELYSRGLIHRVKSHVNWSCSMRSGVSDIEVELREISKPSKIDIPGYDKPVQFGYMYKFGYKLWEDGVKGDEIVVATTRPETMLGDTAIAVHPNDTRYSHLRGKFVWHPFRKCKIPIIADKAVDPETGTGAVKITPAHSPQDLEIGKRHNLPSLNILDESGVLTDFDGTCSEYVGLKRFDARERILSDLTALGLFRGRLHHASHVPFCSRSGDVIEYLMKPHWFLKCKGLYERVWAAISNDQVVIRPDYSKLRLLDWFKNGMDWNLSRQIWWGHRIPMYECEAGNKCVWVPALTEHEARLKAAKELGADPTRVTQDPDVLDTWFSSALLPLSLSGWPDKVGLGYPLDLMETGQDIVFFWVARMMMLGLELSGRLPFNRVFLHGIVCDSHGRKMSKSLGNVILPENVINGITLEEMKAEAEASNKMGLIKDAELKLCVSGFEKTFPEGIPECGTDALRMTLCNDTHTNERVIFDMKVCKANRNMCNKLWQSVIYLNKRTEGIPDLCFKIPGEKECSSLFDRWILSCLSSAVLCANTGISDMEYHSAIRSIRNFFVSQLCDIYLENSKLVLSSEENKDQARHSLAILFNCLETTLRLLSPFAPFVTEELYHCLPRFRGFVPAESLTVAPYPDPKYWSGYEDSDTEKLMSRFIAVVSSLRSLRNTYKLGNQKLNVILSYSAASGDLCQEELTRFLKRYAKVEDVQTSDGDVTEENAIIHSVGDATIYLYHEHDKKSLSSMFERMLSRESSLRDSIEKLSERVGGDEGSSEGKSEKVRTLSRLRQEMEQIENVKAVIERAR